MVHGKIEGMLKESLDDTLEGAVQCLSFAKQNGGCLGYPSAILLFSIIDTIGSFYRRNKGFKIMIDGREKTIDGDKHKHFYILNSCHFKLNLTETKIKVLYDNYRSLLVHNGVMLPEHFIIKGNPNADLFAHTEYGGKKQTYINLSRLLLLCREAICSFKPLIPSIVPQSDQYQNILRKLL